MQPDILNPRRAPRVPLRGLVELRDRFATWHGELEDLGPAGCQIVSARPLVPGREVKLSLRVEALGRTVTAAGKVVWSRAGGALSRLGVAFARSGTERGWFERLLAADEVAASAARRDPDRLARALRVYLGRPPSAPVAFSPTELELLRRVGPGATLDELARSFGPELHERTRGALFHLVARRFLVLDAAAAVPLARWSAILPDDDDVAAEPPATPPRPRLVRWA